MPNDHNDIDQLKHDLEFQKARYDKLVEKVKEVLAAQDECRKKGNRGDLLIAKWKAEGELRQMIDPAKVSQKQFEFLAQ